MLYAQHFVDPGHFGAGDREPYARALRDPSRTVYLRDANEGPTTESAQLEVQRFLGPTDAGDDEVLAAAIGAVIDIGCGPGRFVHAAIMAGHVTLGIDTSPVAVRIAQSQGLPVLERSIFQDLPAEGTWGTALLIDGNIGIGGDPAALLSRCARLVRQGDGRVLIETHPEANRDRVFSGLLVDDLHRRSLPFPWAEVGIGPLRAYAERAGLVVRSEWSTHGRWFAEYARP